jgi:formylglycine-generating enzyme required for sulfatase activity
MSSKIWLIITVLISFISAQAIDYVQAFGTAIVVSSDGYLVADSRLVGAAKTLNITIADKTFTAVVQQIDAKSGFALLKSDSKDLVPFSFVEIEKLAKLGGTSGRVIGYPADPIRGSDLKWVSIWMSLSNANDNPRLLQVHTVPITGSDGYPIIDGQGNIVGFMRSSLGSSRYYSINALPTTTLLAMLKDAGVKILTVEANNTAISEVELKKKVLQSIALYSIPATVDSTQMINVKENTVVVKVPVGEFTMGSKPKEGNPDEEPRQVVKIDGFWIDKYEVTLGQYKKFCTATNRELPELPEWAKDEKPIVNVTWQEAVEYAKWCGGALPTEAQWEKAARGTDLRPFPWGTAPSFDWSTGHKMSNAAMGRGTGALSVGSLEIGTSPYGAQDMAGNVWEWCADWYQPDAYKNMQKTNPAGPEKGTNKVIRGGSWFTTDTEDFRCAARGYIEPGQHNYFTGFRCVYEKLK